MTLVSRGIKSGSRDAGDVRTNLSPVRYFKFLAPSIQFYSYVR